MAVRGDEVLVSRRWALGVVLLAAVGSACESKITRSGGGATGGSDLVPASGVLDEDDFDEEGDQPAIRTDPVGGFTFTRKELDDDPELPFARLGISNVGRGPLIVRGMAVNSVEGDGDFFLSHEVPRFEFGDHAGRPRTNADPRDLCFGSGPFTLQPGQRCVFFLVYQPAGVSSDRALVRISSNDPIDPVARIAIETALFGAELLVTPSGEVVFPDVPLGEAMTRTLHLQNVGTSDLVIHGIELANTPRQEFAVELSDGGGVSDRPGFPALLRPQDLQSLVEVDIRYRPSLSGQVHGWLRVLSNDSQFPVLAIRLSAQSVDRCVRVEPMQTDFGTVVIGAEQILPIDITNCGAAALDITRLELMGESSEEFSLAVGVPGLDRGCIDEPRGPCLGAAGILSGETRTVLARYIPRNPGAGTGQFWHVASVAWPSGSITPINQLYDEAPEPDCP